MDKMPCLPVKITDKRWANSLQDGSVFMRSLHEYGSWSITGRQSKENRKLMINGVQSDVYEGIVQRVDPKTGDEFFNCLSSNFRAAMKDCSYIDEDRYQYYKVYCMYGLTYLLNQKGY